jgi:CheY-like chemotaxis protein
MMPDKDGIETLRDIRTAPDNPNQHTPAVCLTTNAIVGAKEEYLSHGFDSYLTKPIDTVLLEECLLEHLPEEKVIISEATEDFPDTTNPVIAAALSDIKKQNLLNTEAGLKNNTTADAYLSILHMYLGAVDDKAAQLEHMYSENDLSNYAIQIHALKSSSRIIGALDLGDEAQRLENASKSGDTEYLELHHKYFLREYKSLKDKLSVILEKDLKDEIPEEEKQPMDEDVLNKTYNDLRLAAEDMDIDRLEEVLSDKKRYIIPDDEKPVFDKVQEAAGNFDYKAVLEALNTK